MRTMTATAEVQTTRSGRPKVPPLDMARITDEVARDVEAELVKTDKESTPAAHAAELKAYAKELRAYEAAVAEAAKARKDGKEVAEPARPIAPLEDFDAWCEGRRLATLSLLMGQADNAIEMPGGEKHMYRLAVSLHVYEGARGVWRAIGVSRETFSRRHVAVALKSDQWENSPKAWDPDLTPARAREMRVPRYTNAVHELPEVAEKVYRARAIQRYVLPLRNDLLTKLSDEGMTRRELADIIGRNPSRVSHIVAGKGR